MLYLYLKKMKDIYYLILLSNIVYQTHDMIVLIYAISFISHCYLASYYIMSLSYFCHQTWTKSVVLKLNQDYIVVLIRSIHLLVKELWGIMSSSSVYCVGLQVLHLSVVEINKYFHIVKLRLGML